MYGNVNFHPVADTADAVWREAVTILQNLGESQDSRTFRSEKLTDTKEVLHAMLQITDPRQRLVFGRNINPAFAIAEVIWILSHSNDLHFIKAWNPTMANFSDNGETLYGAYGYRLDRSGHDQLWRAYKALQHAPHSRQVLLQIWDYSLDMPHTDGHPRSKDIPCNLMADLKVRDGKLHWMQVMRSNDLIWGTPYNFMQWTTIMEIMAGWLGLELGHYTHIASSLHVYKEHYDELHNVLLPTEVEVDPVEGSGRYYYAKFGYVLEPEDAVDLILPTNEADLRLPYDEWKSVFAQVESIAQALTKVTTVYDFELIHEQAGDLPPAYQQWVALLAAEWMRRHEILPLDVIYKTSLMEDMGEYYAYSWRQWAESKRA